MTSFLQLPLVLEPKVSLDQEFVEFYLLHLIDYSLRLYFGVCYVRGYLRFPARARVFSAIILLRYLEPGRIIACVCVCVRVW